MFTNYRVVWVSADSPGIVEDVAADGIEDILEAEDYASAENSARYKDELDWYARVQRVTYEFV